jgi:ADP-heptose:LPS heptosyltransferase
VLLVRAGALGDILLLRPTVAALRGAGHRVRLLAPSAGNALVGAGPSEVEEHLPWDGPELARILAREATSGPLGAALGRADVAIAYTRAGSLACALRPRVGRLLLRDPSPPPTGPHASLWLAEPIAALGLPLPVDRSPRAKAPASVPESPDLSFSSAEREAAAQLLSALPPRFLALHPGSGSPAKCWPADRFAALATRHAGASRFLVVLGPAEDDRRWDRMRDAVVARELPLRTLGALLSHAGLFVGNDSGVSHLAAACGAPTLALFGPTDPGLWSPVGRSVRCLRAPDHSLAALTIDDVSREAAALQPHVNGERTSIRLIRR